MSEAEPTDQEVVARFRVDGDPRCLEVLVRRHTARVRSLVFALVLNDADADDVAQDAMLRALAGLRTFRGEAGFATWLHRIAVNTAKNFLRQRNRHRAFLVDDCELEEVADEPHRSPSRQAESAELDSAVTAAMARLPVDQRAAISLVVLEGLPEREAARVAGCNAATLRWRLHRARQRLRAMLDGGDPQRSMLNVQHSTSNALRERQGVRGNEG